MITITKSFRNIKKKEWSIYHNIGAQQDAERFSLIDNVLDVEYDNLKKVAREKDAAESNFLKRIGNLLIPRFLSHK